MLHVFSFETKQNGIKTKGSLELRLQVGLKISVYGSFMKLYYHFYKK